MRQVKPRMEPFTQADFVVLMVLLTAVGLVAVMAIVAFYWTTGST